MLCIYTNVLLRDMHKAMSEYVINTNSLTGILVATKLSCQMLDNCQLSSIVMLSIVSCFYRDVTEF